MIIPPLLQCACVNFFYLRLPPLPQVACMPGCRAACTSLAMQPTLALNLQARLFLRGPLGRALLL